MDETTTNPTPEAKAHRLPNLSRQWAEKFLPFAGLAGLFLVLSILSPRFLTIQNLSNVARQTAVINIMALGMTLIIISRRH